MVIGTGRVVEIVQEVGEGVAVPEREADSQLQAVGGGQTVERFEMQPGDGSGDMAGHWLAGISGKGQEHGADNDRDLDKDGPEFHGFPPVQIIGWWPSDYWFLYLSLAVRGGNASSNR